MFDGMRKFPHSRRTDLGRVTRAASALRESTHAVSVHGRYRPKLNQLLDLTLRVLEPRTFHMLGLGRERSNPNLVSYCAEKSSALFSSLHKN